MAINIMRTKLGVPRKEKDLYDTFNCDDLTAQTLVRALRLADDRHWYWYEDESKYQAPHVRANYWDASSRVISDEVLETAS